MDTMNALLQAVPPTVDTPDLAEYAPLETRCPRFELALQAIVSLDARRGPAWIECLLRPVADRPAAPVMDLVREGYARRGHRFDLDVLAAALDRASVLRAETRIGVNIRPGSLTRPGFVDAVLRLLDRTRIEPARLVLELVEFDGAVELASSRQPLTRLRDAGIGIALDDFGPGAPNLDVVAAGLVDWIKLDRSLCQDIDRHVGAHRVVAGLAALVRHAGPRLVAEGIERPAQMHALRALGIVHQQGFLFHRPVRTPAPPTSPRTH